MSERTVPPADEPPASSAIGVDLIDDEGLDLPCPVCGTDLTGDDRFAAMRVCSGCGRHFALTARERLTLLVDPGSFSETNAQLVSVDPLIFHDRLSPDRLTGVRERAELPESVVTGVGSIGGAQAVLIALDCAYLGGSIGVVAGEKITLAMELALTRRLPLVALCSGGGARTHDGMLSLVQLAKTTAAATRLHRAGVPFVAVLTHSTTGGVYAGLANQADVILAEPGAHIGLRSLPGVVAPGERSNTAEFMLDHGTIDAIVERDALRSTLATLLGFFAFRGSARPIGQPIPAIGPSTAVPSWEAAALMRHPDRPTALDYIHRLLADFIELRGDRITGDDPAVVCGLGRLHGVSVAVIAQERGRGGAAADRNGGRMSAAGYRKAARLLRLAGHLELPVVTLIDTPGAASGVEAEAAGIGVAMAQAFGLLPLLPVPIVSAVIGEAGGLGALVLAAGDRVLMLERAMYAPAGPEWTRPTSPASELERGERGPATRLSARECRRLGVIDVVVPEPGAGAHVDPGGAARSLGAALLDALAELSGIGPRRLVDERSRRLRNLGLTTPEGREEARREVHELQEWQRSLARSFGEWRGRWEGRTHGRPRLPVSLHRPDLTDLAARLAARRAAVGTRLAGQADEPGASAEPATDTIEASAAVDNGRR